MRNGLLWVKGRYELVQVLEYSGGYLLESMAGLSIRSRSSIFWSIHLS